MNPTQPAKSFWLFVLAVGWAFFGLTGRDAWRPEEALVLAPVLDWLAGEAGAWSAPAPLHTLLAGLFALGASPWLDVQDGARLASGVFTLAALGFTALSARLLLGAGFGAAALLALLGCLGMMLRMHAMAPEPALLAAWSALIAGMALSRQSWRAGGVVSGLAVLALGLGLRGLPDLLAALALLGLPLLLRDWRHSDYRRALFLALGLTLLGAAAALLQMSAGGQLEAWWQHHGPARIAAVEFRSRGLNEWTWFTWPLWPLALATLWHEHRRLVRARELHLPLLALLLALLLLPVPAWSREGGLVPLLPPLALLAVHGVETLRRGAAQAFYWFGVLCFLFFLLAFWVYFAAIEWGMPAHLADRAARLAPLYQSGAVTTWSVLLGMAATLLWLIAIPLFPRSKSRPVLVWASGMALIWLLLMALYRPWVEAGTGYRPLIDQLRGQLPAGACLRVETDPAMAAMVRYHLNPRAGDACPWLLSTTRREDALPLWQGFRPRQKQIRYYLYREAT